jgi:hypothetical protein
MVLGILAIGLLALLFCRSEISACAQRIPRKHWLFLAGILAMVSIVRLMWVPAIERLYFDEHAYRQMADSIVSDGHSYVATSGRIVANRLIVNRPVYEHWPAGWPTILALLQVLFREGGTGAGLNLMLSLVTSVFVALIAARDSKAGELPLIAGAFHAFVPAVALWSRTGSSETMAAFLAAAAVLSATIVARSPTSSAQALVGAICGLGAMTRNEFLLLFPVVLWTAATTQVGIKLRQLWILVTMMACFLPVQALHLGIVARGYDRGAEGAGMSLAYVWRNLSSFGDYLSYEPFLLLLVLFAIPSCRKRTSAPLVAWGMVVIVPTVFYYAGSLSFPGGERFVLAWAGPCALLAATTVVNIHKRWFGWLTRSLRLSITAAFITVCFLWIPIYTQSADQASRVPRSEVAMLRGVLKQVPHGAIVASFFPFVILAEGYAAESLTDSHSVQRLCELSRKHLAGVYLWLGPTAGPEAHTALGYLKSGSMDRCRVEKADIVDTGNSARLYRIRNTQVSPLRVMGPGDG